MNKMICCACKKLINATEKEDCFEKALEVLKQHYTYNKNILQQRDLELQRIKEHNERLEKAVKLLQNPQQTEPAAKRFKSQSSEESWLAPNSSQEDRVIISDLSLTDDEAVGASNLNMALNSEQLFDTSNISVNKNDVSMMSSSEVVQSPRHHESPKRNKQRDDMRLLKDRNKNLDRTKADWHKKERNSPTEKCWAMKFLEPNKSSQSTEKMGGEIKKIGEKKLCLSLRKTNPSKMKQSLIHFNKSKEGSFRESDIGDDIIDASPVILNKNSKAGRSWSHRSGPNHSSNITSSSTTIASANVTTTKADTNKTLDDIVFDFSPSKKSNETLDLCSPPDVQPKQLKFGNDISTDCTSLANDHLGMSSCKSDSSSVVILTPGTQDIIFVDDTCSYAPDIDTMDLLADLMKPGTTDNLEKLKKYESKCIQKQQSKESDVFKKPTIKQSTNINLGPIVKVKQEKITQDLQNQTKLKSDDEKPSCSTSTSSIKTIKPQNPLFSDENDTDDKEINKHSTKATKPLNPIYSTGENDTDDEDFMPVPFVIKQESDSKTKKKLSIKERFNIECEDCEKLVNFLDKGLTDAQIQQHLDKCKRHNNNDYMRQNTPKDFWNPFILSFQADDPRNEILIDNRFKDSKKQ